MLTPKKAPKVCDSTGITYENMCEWKKVKCRMLTDYKNQGMNKTHEYTYSNLNKYNQMINLR